MTAKLDDLRARTRKALARFVAYHNEGNWLELGGHRLRREELYLIVRLARIWRDWKHKSPLTRDPVDHSYPFADWVISLFKRVKGTDIRPPTRDAIRRTLTHGKRQQGCRRKVWSV